MKNLKSLTSSLCMTGLMLFSSGVQASVRPFSPDLDLSGPRGPRLNNVSLDLAPDLIEVSNKSGPLGLQVWREDRGALVQVPGLMFTPSACLNKTTLQVMAPLENRSIQVKNDRSETYRIVADVPCQGLVKLIFRKDTNGGQAVGIWQVADRGRRMLENEVGLEFWRRPMTFIWPSNGDYYTFGRVHITRGDYWDVVGHEMGHAVYDLGGLGVWGGGQHKIDECYSDAMALSEGWASYFSAWVSLDRRDPDAKFEYMVPRRAPLRIEYIPADVCAGPTNEWRVTGFFWDLIDLNNDGETSDAPFKVVWESMFNRRAQNMEQVRSLLENRGFGRELLQTVWLRNFVPSLFWRR